MNEQKTSERMQEVIDLYEQNGLLLDPIWVQFQGEIAALEAELKSEIQSRDGWRDAWKKSEAALEECKQASNGHALNEAIALRGLEAMERFGIAYVLEQDQDKVWDALTNQQRIDLIADAQQGQKEETT